MDEPSASPVSPTDDKPPNPRRWIPVSLRIFVAILLLLGAGNAFPIGVRIYRQQTAIRVIHRFEGACSMCDGGPYWLRRCLGHERMRLFDDVLIVNLSGTAVADSDLTMLKGLTRLKFLDLSDTEVTDAGLIHLRGLTALTHLSLGRTQVTDAGLAHLMELSDLESLRLNRTRVSDAGLTQLNRLKRLQEVSVRGTLVTNAGLHRSFPRLFDEQ